MNAFTNLNILENSLFIIYSELDTKIKCLFLVPHKKYAKTLKSHIGSPSCMKLHVQFYVLTFSIIDWMECVGRKYSLSICLLANIYKQHKYPRLLQHNKNLRNISES